MTWKDLFGRLARESHVHGIWTKVDVLAPCDCAMTFQPDRFEVTRLQPRMEDAAASKIRKIDVACRPIVVAKPDPESSSSLDLNWSWHHLHLLQQSYCERDLTAVAASIRIPVVQAGTPGAAGRTDPADCLQIRRERRCSPRAVPGEIHEQSGDFRCWKGQVAQARNVVHGPLDSATNSATLAQLPQLEFFSRAALGHVGFPCRSVGGEPCKVDVVPTCPVECTDSQCDNCAPWEGTDVSASHDSSNSDLVAGDSRSPPPTTRH